MKQDFVCTAWRTKLALRQEDFSLSEWRVFLLHLRTCSFCAARRATYGMLVTELQLLPPPSLPPPPFFPPRDDAKQEEQIQETTNQQPWAFSQRMLESLWEREEPWAVEDEISPPSYEDALAACEQGLTCHPNAFTSLTEKAKLLFALQRYEEVLTVTAQILRGFLRDVEAWQIQAQTLYRLGHYQKAVNACNAALALGANTAEIWKIKARSLLFLEEYREALRTCENASEMDTDDAELWQIKACVLFFLDREKEAHDENGTLL